MAMLWGQNHGSAKLDDREAEQVRQLRGVMSVRQVARHFGIGKSQVSRIQRGEERTLLALDGGPPR